MMADDTSLSRMRRARPIRLSHVSTEPISHDHATPPDAPMHLQHARGVHQPALQQPCAPRDWVAGNSCTPCASTALHRAATPSRFLSIFVGATYGFRGRHAIANCLTTHTWAGASAAIACATEPRKSFFLVSASSIEPSITCHATRDGLGVGALGRALTCSYGLLT
eukprot:1419247-Prymnesium_polylepis.1